MRALTIRTKLVISSVVLVVVAMSLLAFANYRSASQAISQLAISRAVGVTMNTAGIIDDWLHNKFDILASTEAAATKWDPVEQLTQARLAGEFDSVYFGWPSKRFVTSPVVDVGAGYDPTSRDWYQGAAQQRQWYLTEPYADAMSGEQLVTLAVPIISGREVTAVVGGDISVKNLTSRIANIQPTKHSFAYLVDKNGKVIAHADANLVNESATAVFPDIDTVRIAALATEGGVAESSIAGEAYWLSAQPIPNSTWVVVVAMHQADSLVVLGGMRNQSIVSSAVGGVIAALLLGLVTTRLLRRLGLLQEALEDIASGDGDLTHRLDESGGDELAKVGVSFNIFIAKIATIMQSIRESTESVHVAASQIATGNIDLASRTGEAASSIQETATAMEQLSSAVQQTADAGMAADQLAGSARTAAEDGGELMLGVVGTMDEINVSANRINEIVGVIDSIAFQTNILALNAAVEAARADKHGHGFAVVAAEVRALAQRSAQSAREIATLIGESVQKVQEGSAQVQMARTAMDRIVTEVQRVSEVIGEIKVATNEQSAGIRQVGVAVNQLESMTQQNSALVSESAAAAESLREQADMLNALVGGFRLESDANVYEVSGAPALLRHATYKEQDRFALPHKRY